MTIDMFSHTSWVIRLPIVSCFSTNVFTSLVFVNVIMWLAYILHKPNRKLASMKTELNAWKTTPISTAYTTKTTLNSQGTHIQRKCFVNEQILMCDTLYVRYTHTDILEMILVKTNLMPLPWGQLSLHSLGLSPNTAEQTCPNCPQTCSVTQSRPSQLACYSH